MPGAGDAAWKEPLSSAQRLVQAVLEGWRDRGSANLSVRALAQAAALPPSGIYHHFGALEHLYLAAQEQARAAAERWCAAQLDAVPGAAGLSPKAFPVWLAALIDEWATEQRALAFAWRECLLLAMRDARYLPALQSWQSLWSDFWEEASARCGLAGSGTLVSCFFDGESLLHLMQWRPAVDRACLDEICQGLGDWLAGRLAPEGPWRRFARTAAEQSMPALPARGGPAERIAIAAAETVERHGMAGLTHRAVATQANVTLGLVSYNFRTSADLARAAFEMIYRRLVPAATQAEAEPAGNAAAAIEEIAGYHRGSPSLLAIEELLVATARDPQLELFRPQLRYLRGRTSRRLLQALLGGHRTLSPVDAALFSSFGTGQRRACLGATPDETDGFVREGLSRLRSLLDDR